MAIALVVSSTTMTGAAAQQQPVPATVTLSPASGVGPTGSCWPYTATVTTQDGQPIQGATVDVRQGIWDPRFEPDSITELYFCDPSPGHPRNPTGQGGTAISDISGNNPSETPGEQGRNTSVRAEVGPTDANGDVTFGITMSPDIASGRVFVQAWADLNGNDNPELEEPLDHSEHTWVHADQWVSVIDAGPEVDTNPNGTQHTVTVAVSTFEGQPVQGFTPDSVILPDASGPAGGDVASPAAGASPNATVRGAPPSAYSCTPSNSQGISTCTFQDPLSTPTGTDTVVFFWDRGGEARWPDSTDPRDAVQKTWATAATPSPSPSPTPTIAPTPSPIPSPSPSPSPTPVGGAARNVRLCQGSSSTPCDTSPHEREPGDLHEVAALVTDRNGAPVANVVVEFRQIGPAYFTATAAAVVTVVTGNDGVARAVITSDQEGASTVVAEISPPGAPGSVRGPGPTDDECEQPAGPGGTPPAGNCVSQTLAVTWDDPVVNGHDCDDALDNDGDGYVDYPEDPGCTDDNDGSEDPFNPAQIGHPRTISMLFRDANDGRLVVSGRVRLADADDTYRRCIRGREVEIQRLVHDVWVTKGRDTTNRRGRYSGAFRDVPGTYRAVAVPAQLTVEDVAVHTCRRADKEKTHHHRK